MQITSKQSLTALTTELEDIWAKFDELYTSIRPTQWAEKFGKDWTFADQPYHLAFFDRILVAEPLKRWSQVPEQDRFLLRSLKDINEWNAREFAKRPATQTPEKSLEEMRASREAIRQTVAPWTDQDLGQPVWEPLLLGSTTAGDVLTACIVHSVGEYTELRLRLERKTPELRPTATHTRLNFMMSFMGLTVNRERAKRTPFTMVWNFTGPGGGTWTFRVANGRCSVTEERTSKAELTLRMRPETFEKLTRKMSNPMLLMFKREMKVRGFRKMRTFSQLFPEPKPEDRFEPGSAGLGAAT
jgi:hypothetical protein